MPKGYRPYLPDQDLLLPPSLRDWLSEDHLVYFVSDVVDQLDLSAIYAWYGEEKRGQPPHDPLLMTKLLVYGYCTGVFSSRRLQKRIQEDIPFKVLAAGNEPDFRTISEPGGRTRRFLIGLPPIPPSEPRPWLVLSEFSPPIQPNMLDNTPNPAKSSLNPMRGQADQTWIFQGLPGLVILPPEYQARNSVKVRGAGSLPSLEYCEDSE